jgi:molybdopterin biosynthesis enzyme
MLLVYVVVVSGSSAGSGKIIADAHDVTLQARITVMCINVHPGQLGLHGKRP